MQTILSRNGYDPEQDANNGNRFLISNGYMGVRGTIGEAGPEQKPAVNLNGMYHQKKGSLWCEPLNAPNLCFRHVRELCLPEHADLILRHELSVDIMNGVFRRKTVYLLDGIMVDMVQERFCSMNRQHMIGQRLLLKADKPIELHVRYGIDDQVWDMNGPHYERMDVLCRGHIVSITGETDCSQKVISALRVPDNRDGAESAITELTVRIGPGAPYELKTVGAVYTSNDTPDPVQAAFECLRNAPDYDTLLAQQEAAWSGLWNDARVEIEGDSEAEFAMNYAIYQLISAAPRHADNLSVPAHGLSGQSYRGAIFWYSEMFMLSFYLYTMPEVARSCLKYRVESLPMAMEKARDLGFEGAFYAWESQDGGREACSDYNVSDVFTGRPLRTYFRSKQVHISAAIVHGLKRYLETTGDNTLMREGGARVVLECARFYMSLISRKLTSRVYDINDVVGADEYHERINNDAYTNEMARITLNWAADICPIYLPDVTPGEMASFRDAAVHLKRQRPRKEDKVIPQFDDYFKLQDPSLEEVRSRLLDSREYWGGAYGVASNTQIIKSADVILMLDVTNGQEKYPKDVLKANLDYYMPRTEFGDTLSYSSYALAACMAGEPDEAYPLFMHSAETDMVSENKKWAGLIYIDGNHPAAAGGAYTVLLHGFMGLNFERGQPVLHPNLPAGWKHIRTNLMFRGRRYTIEV